MWTKIGLNNKAIKRITDLIEMLTLIRVDNIEKIETELYPNGAFHIEVTLRRRPINFYMIRYEYSEVHYWEDYVHIGFMYSTNHIELTWKK